MEKYIYMTIGCIIASITAELMHVYGYSHKDTEAGNNIVCSEKFNSLSTIENKELISNTGQELGQTRYLKNNIRLQP